MARHDIIAIGASAGGLEALTALIRELPPNLPAALFVVVHTSPHTPTLLTSILDRQGSLRAVEAQDGHAIVPGTIYVAPPDRHLLVRPGHLELSRGPRENHARPAVDPLFRTAARAYGSRVVGVVLSGALGDGATGLMAIAARGGVSVVQEPADALVDAMPRAALAAVRADYVVPVREMPAVLTSLARDEEASEGETEMSDIDELEDDAAAALPQRDISAQVLGQRANQTAIFTCPDCGGALWQINQNGVIQFTCHVGHRYGAEVLLGQISEELEAALWRCIRILTEKATLTRQLAQRIRSSGDTAHAARVQEQAQLDERQQALVRALVTEGTLGHATQLVMADEGWAGTDDDEANGKARNER